MLRLLLLVVEVPGLPLVVVVEPRLRRHPHLLRAGPAGAVSAANTASASVLLYPGSTESSPRADARGPGPNLLAGLFLLPGPPFCWLVLGPLLSPSLPGQPGSANILQTLPFCTPWPSGLPTNKGIWADQIAEVNPNEEAGYMKWPLFVSSGAQTRASPDYHHSSLQM